MAGGPSGERIKRVGLSEKGRRVVHNQDSEEKERKQRKAEEAQQVLYFLAGGKYGLNGSVYDEVQTND